MSHKLECYNGFIHVIQHIDNKTQFEEKILFIFLKKKAYMYSLPKSSDIRCVDLHVHLTRVFFFFYHIWYVYQCVEL